MTLRPPANRMKNKRRLLKYLSLTALCILIVLPTLLVLPLRVAEPATTAFILADRSGRIPVARTWRDWDAISPQFALAAIAAEDQKFPYHAGFDLESIRKSVATRSNGGRLRGASTISQQLTKNLFLWRGRSYVRKGLEAWLTAYVELYLPKKRILELYLNVVEFGPGIYGVEAASRQFYGKPAAAVNRREAALLVTVLPNPLQRDVRRPGDHMRERQRWVISQMARLERERVLAAMD